MNYKEKNFISVVVYVRNNEGEITDFFTSVFNAINEKFEKFEFIFVDDASTDNTNALISKLSKSFKNGNITIVKMSYKQGVEKSMNAGIDLSIGDYVYEFDNCVIDYDISLLFKLYDKLLEGNDVVSATYRRRSIVSSLFYKIYNHSSNKSTSISTEKIRIISRRAINRVHMISKTVPYRKAVYANCGLKTSQIEYEINTTNRKRKGAHTELSTGFNTLILFTNIAYKLSLYLSILMVMATIGVAIYAIIVYFSQNPVPGFTPLILVMTLSFSAIFAVFSVVIKYLQIITELVFYNVDYVISGIEKMN